MVPDRLVGPAGDGGKHRFRRIPGDLRHQLSELGESAATLMAWWKS
jgi:hypothetical protein